MKNQTVKRLLIFGYIALLIFQFKTTNVQEAYHFNAFQIDQQIRRMNTYPPEFARLGYILEVKKEIQFIKRLESNFFAVIDFGEYFPTRYPYFIAPFFFLGLIVSARQQGISRNVVNTFLFSLIILTLLGPYAQYGPVLLIPFVGYFALSGLIKTMSMIKQ